MAENANDVTEMEADRNEDQPYGATGGENIQTPFHQASGDSDESKTEPSTKSKRESGKPIFPISSSSERDEGRPCTCSSSHFGTIGAGSQAQCMFCGGHDGAINTSHTNGKNSNKSTANPVSTTSGEFNILTHSYAVSLPSLPDTSLEDGGCSNSQHDVESLVTGLSRGQGKTPVHNVCQLWVQSPSPGITIRIFLFERTFPDRNEKWFTLYMIPESECQVYEQICYAYKEAAIQQGFSRQIPFAVDNSRSQEFHTLYVQEQISVSFQIENRYQGNFIAPDERNESVFRVPVIISESKNRLARGAKSQFRVQYVGEPGKPCQEQGKITLTIDNSEETTLFFSIAIWSSIDVHVTGEEQGE